MVGQVKSHDVMQPGFERMRVVGKEDESRQTGRTDGVALGHGLGRIADGVERVGDVAHFLRQSGHLCDAAGAVGDRPVSVERDDDAGHRQHRGRESQPDERRDRLLKIAAAAAQVSVITGDAS